MLENISSSSSISSSASFSAAGGENVARPEVPSSSSSSLSESSPTPASRMKKGAEGLLPSEGASPSRSQGGPTDSNSCPAASASPSSSAVAWVEEGGGEAAAAAAATASPRCTYTSNGPGSSQPPVRPPPSPPSSSDVAEGCESSVDCLAASSNCLDDQEKKRTRVHVTASSLHPSPRPAVLVTSEGGSSFSEVNVALKIAGGGEDSAAVSCQSSSAGVSCPGRRDPGASGNSSGEPTLRLRASQRGEDTKKDSRGRGGLDLCGTREKNPDGVDSREDESVRSAVRVLDEENVLNEDAEEVGSFSGEDGKKEEAKESRSTARTSEARQSGEKSPIGKMESSEVRRKEKNPLAVSSGVRTAVPQPPPPQQRAVGGVPMTRSHSPQKRDSPPPATLAKTRMRSNPPHPSSKIRFVSSSHPNIKRQQHQASEERQASLPSMKDSPKESLLEADDRRCKLASSRLPEPSQKRENSPKTLAAMSSSGGGLSKGGEEDGVYREDGSPHVDGSADVVNHVRKPQEQHDERTPEVVQGEVLEGEVEEKTLKTVPLVRSGEETAAEAAQEEMTRGQGQVGEGLAVTDAARQDNKSTSVEDVLRLDSTSLYMPSTGNVSGSSRSTTQRRRDLDSRGLKEKPQWWRELIKRHVEGDGNCMFRAFSDQVRGRLGIQNSTWLKDWQR